MVWPAIIGAGASLLGNALGAITSSGNAGASNAAANQNMWQQYQFQREFAENGIRWKVEDAKRAGIHPLFALGGSTATYTPTSFVGATDNTPQYLSNMGQDVSRAISATQTAPERKLSDYDRARQVQELERGQLQNDVLRMQLASASARLSPSQVGPTMPSSTSPVPAAVAGTYEAKPPEVLNSQPSNSGAQAGPSQPSVRWERNSDGSVVAMPTANMDDFSSPGYLNWQYQNRVLPAFGDAKKYGPPAHMLPEGAIGWRFAFPGRWVPDYGGPGPSYGEGVHYAPRRARALPRVILNP